MSSPPVQRRSTQKQTASKPTSIAPSAGASAPPSDFFPGAPTAFNPALFQPSALAPAPLAPATTTLHATGTASRPPTAGNKRKAGMDQTYIRPKAEQTSALPPGAVAADPNNPATPGPSQPTTTDETTQPPPLKKTRTNTPWSPAEEKRLKAMRDQGSSWSDIAKEFPKRTEGSVKKHWYKDMHYAEFAEDETAALLEAIREYDANKWKVIGQKVGKPAKACEQYAKENFQGKM